MIIDALIIGGGFYGTSIAINLVEKFKFKDVIIIEKEDDVLKRSSQYNQARLHNGYHYPRSLATGLSSRYNLGKFLKDYPEVYKRSFKSIYAIAKNSKTSSQQFQKFCKTIGAKFSLAKKEEKEIFSSNYIDEVFLTEEYIYDSKILTDKIKKRIQHSKIELLLSSKVLKFDKKNRHFAVEIECQKNKSKQIICSKKIFNCAYSGINNFANRNIIKTSLKHEVAEISLIKVPNSLKGYGITVIDGPFFSLMPYPTENLHSLSHVRYTPHFYWLDQGTDAYKKLNEYHKISRYNRMIKDASRYLPIIQKSKYIKSFFEVKTILQKNEGNDGRPILYEKNQEMDGFFSILGGKIDNIYDIFEKVNKDLKS